MKYHCQVPLQLAIISKSALERTVGSPLLLLLLLLQLLLLLLLQLLLLLLLELHLSWLLPN